jgi:hypothetical protein
MQETVTRFLIIALLQIGTISSFGQQHDTLARQGKNYVRFHLGPIHTRLINDGYARKLLFGGTNLKLGLAYGRETTKFVFGFSVEASSGRVKSRSGKLPSDFQLIIPSLTYLKKITRLGLTGEKTTLLAGVSLSSANYLMINQPIFDNISILSLHGVYCNIGYQVQLDEKRRLQFAYQLPAMVYTNHLLWNGGARDLSHDDQEHVLRALTTRGSFGYFDIAHNIRLTAGYEKQLGKSACFVATYEFMYLSSSSPALARIYSNELLIGLKFRF